MPPEAVSVTLAPFDQPDEPPLTAGTVGLPVSSLTVVFVQADVNPDLSIEWNCTSVMPSRVMTALLPAIGADQVMPPSGEVSYS